MKYLVIHCFFTVIQNTSHLDIYIVDIYIVDPQK